MRNDNVLLELSLVFLMILAIVGYVWNIVKLVQSDVITGMVIARVAGIFLLPLGAILGYF